MERSFSDLEKFLHADTALPPIIEIALVHYQFETIHPFLDGNGRLGRLLIAFLLLERDLLPQPLLYLSAYFERRRSDYYDRLQAVREKGQLDEWLEFFLLGVTEQATDAVTRAEALIDLRESFRQRLHGDRSRAIEVVDLVFENPVLTTSWIRPTTPDHRTERAQPHSQARRPRHNHRNRRHRRTVQTLDRPRSPQVTRPRRAASTQQA